MYRKLQDLGTTGSAPPGPLFFLHDAEGGEKFVHEIGGEKCPPVVPHIFHLGGQGIGAARSGARSRYGKGHSQGFMGGKSASSRSTAAAILPQDRSGGEISMVEQLPEGVYSPVLPCQQDEKELPYQHMLARLSPVVTGHEVARS